MKMTTRIATGNVCVRIKSIADAHGFTTVGQLYKFISKCQPHTKIYFNATYTRASNVLYLLNKELA